MTTHNQYTTKLKPAWKEIWNCQSLRKWWRVCHYLNSQNDNRWKLVKTTATGIRNLAIFCNIFRYSWTCSMNINHDLRSKFIQLVFPQFFKAVFYSGYKKKVMDGETSFNGTEMENATAHRRDEVKVISLSLKAILIVPTIFGNSLVFKAFYKFPSLRTASNIILVSLSVADSFSKDALHCCLILDHSGMNLINTLRKVFIVYVDTNL